MGTGRVVAVRASMGVVVRVEFMVGPVMVHEFGGTGKVSGGRADSDNGQDGKNMKPPDPRRTGCN